MERSNIRGLVLSFTVMGSLMVPLSIELVKRSHPPSTIFFGLFSLFLWGVLFLALGMTDLLKRVKGWCNKNQKVIFYITSSISIPWFIYAAGTGESRPVIWVSVLLYIMAPLFIMYDTLGREHSLGVREIAFICLIFLPINHGFLHKCFIWPENLGAAAYTNFLGVILVVVILEGYLGVEGIGYRFKFYREDLGIILKNFCIFMVIALPIGIFSSFVTPSGNIKSPGEIFLSFIGIFLLIAIPEEVLFRGVIQNLLTKSLKRPRIALIVSAMIFSLSHANKAGVPDGPIPDYRYLILAGIAGIFYGLSYQKGKTLMPAVMVHTLVDLTWANFLI
ncbi:MAG: CPBP family intramembrane metalloprotease [Oligoflexales bacterium]|nr:CPBP family intramembrane metalloprotease [Oligoflexales bacterium]